MEYTQSKSEEFGWNTVTENIGPDNLNILRLQEN